MPMIDCMIDDYTVFGVQITALSVRCIINLHEIADNLLPVRRTCMPLGRILK